MFLGRLLNVLKIPKRMRRIRVKFVNPMGKTREVYVNDGQNILEAAHENEINLEGACGGALACATCHVIIGKRYYDRLKPASDIENDLLDTAYGLVETSRLGCQINITKSLKDMDIHLPPITKHLNVDGHIPRPH